MALFKRGLTSAELRVLHPGTLTKSEHAKLLFKVTIVLDRWARRPARQIASTPMRMEIWTELIEPDGDQTREATDANLSQR
jgi:hypothetical protein